MTIPSPSKNVTSALSTEALPSGESRQIADSARAPAWLVSVRDEQEFRLAAEYPVDIIDFKEPDHGPLAPVDPLIWHQAQRWVAECCTSPSQLRPQKLGQHVAKKLSAALGERGDMLRVADEVPAEFAFAKVGPSQCDTPEKLLTLWSDARARLPKRVELVAVAYADYTSAQCLPPEQIAELAKQTGVNRCLIDTFTKSSGSTVDLLGMQRLRQFSQTVANRDGWWALAGAVRLEGLNGLADNGVLPNCVGVRGDVCNKSRTSTLSIDRLDQWSEFFANVPTSEIR
ncbi:MAG: (5-formylfuran-3-yl)methyl phosphate synthase [Pirellulaceae bacterium]